MRDADSWTKIDYTAEAKTWMKPLRKGNETGLVCIPANWYVVIDGHLIDKTIHFLWAAIP
jgi:hypothetical protein